MTKYYIFSSEKVYYTTIIDADNAEEAKQKFWDMDHNSDTLYQTESENWQIDDIVDEQTILKINS